MAKKQLMTLCTPVKFDAKALLEQKQFDKKTKQKSLRKRKINKKTVFCVTFQKW